MHFLPLSHILVQHLLSFSKPGASASAVYLAHVTIGLTPSGYGTLLAEAMFTCRRVSHAHHWLLCLMLVSF